MKQVRKTGVPGMREHYETGQSGKNILGRRKSQSKGPRARTGLECSRKAERMWLEPSRSKGEE